MIGPRSGVGGDGEGSGILSWIQDSCQDDAVPSYFAPVQVVGSIPVRLQALLVSHLEMCYRVFATAKSH